MDDGDDGADNPTNLLNKSAQFNKMAVDFYFEKVLFCSFVGMVSFWIWIIKKFRCKL